MPSTANGVSERAEEPEYEADEDEKHSDGPEEGNPGDKSDEE